MSGEFPVAAFVLAGRLMTGACNRQCQTAECKRIVCAGGYRWWFDRWRGVGCGRLPGNLPGGGLIGGNDELVFFFATHGAYTRGFGDYWSGPDAAR